MLATIPAMAHAPAPPLLVSDVDSFKSVKELVAMIDTFTRQWNEGSSPFSWVRTADEILAKAVRKDRAISESRH